MFPNIRLMIVAVLASILGISCALGLFAEFRVSHDSFLRESNASAPIQLGANDAAPARVMNTAVPFEFRFQAPPAAAETAGRTIISENAAAVEPAPVAAVVTPMAVAAPGPALAAPPADGVSGGPMSAATGSIAPENTQQEASRAPLTMWRRGHLRPRRRSATRMPCRRPKSCRSARISAARHDASSSTADRPSLAEIAGRRFGSGGEARSHWNSARLSMGRAIRIGSAANGASPRHCQAGPPGKTAGKRASRRKHHAADGSLQYSAG